MLIHRFLAEGPKAVADVVGRGKPDRQEVGHIVTADFMELHRLDHGIKEQTRRSYAFSSAPA